MQRYNPITCMMEEVEKCKPMTKDAREKVKYVDISEKKVEEFLNRQDLSWSKKTRMGGIAGIIYDYYDNKGNLIAMYNPSYRVFYYFLEPKAKNVSLKNKNSKAKDVKVKDASSDQLISSVKILANTVETSMKGFYAAENRGDEKSMQDNLKMLKIQQKRLSKIGSDLEFVITHLEDLI